MKKRVADIIMDILVENGITDCFCVVGGGAMHLNNALAMRNDITTYFNHHEQACAIAADSYARLSGKIPLVCVTSGPGGTNALTGVMGAWQDSLPMLVISGQVRYETSVPQCGLELRYRGIQEFEVIPTVAKMTKYATMLTDPLAIRQELQKCIDISLSGRRGPAWLDIPLDVQAALVDLQKLYPTVITNSEPCCTLSEITELTELIKSAKRPVLLAGNGIVNSGNTGNFREYASRLGVPVIAAAIASDVMYAEHPNFYGMAGTIGPRTGNFILQNADVIVTLGCSLGYKMTGFAVEYFAPNAYICAIDIDENEMKKPGIRVNRLIHSDLTYFLKHAIPEATEINITSEWRNYCEMLKSKFSPYDPAVNIDVNEKVCSYFFWKEYEQQEPDDGITVLGNNTASSAKLQIGVRTQNQRIVASNNCGSMGADLPEAIGAAVVTGRQVICLTGDGSIMMNLQEMQTIKHYDLPIKIVVFSNDGYNAIRQTCKNFFDGVYIGADSRTGISFPDFSKVAECFGFTYKKCASNNEVRDCLSWLLAEHSNCILEVQQRLDDPVNPRLMSRMSEDGVMQTPALHDMFPFIDEVELHKLMVWEN